MKIFIDPYNLPQLLSNPRKTNEKLSGIFGENVVLDRSLKILLFDKKLCSYFKEKYKEYFKERYKEHRKRHYRDAIKFIDRIVGKRKDNIINGCLGGSIKKYKDRIFKIKFHSEEYNYFIACTEKLLTQYEKGDIYVILSIGPQMKNAIDYIKDYLRKKIHDLQYVQTEITPKKDIIIFYRE